jgi:hypothetical protein
VKRFAYERFGPDVLDWKKQLTRWELIKTGFGQTITYYVAAYIGLVISSFFGYAANMRWWQVFITTTLFVFEARTISSPTFPFLTLYFFNPLLSLLKRPEYLPFQTIQVIRRIAVSGFLALTHLSPVLTQPTLNSDTPEAQQKAINQLAMVIQELDGDAQRMLNTQAAPFIGDEIAEPRLKQSLVSWLVQNEVRNTKEVQTAIQKVVRRKNGEVDELDRDGSDDSLVAE